ncbi:MAG: glycoside hydrolase family 140 protein [Bacteroidetes bacterium]|nr:glycoside hydrolase family 140 protein [Bacteroidota bacterium]MDA1121876.1 glycoside hydrolase family 140 protein [Bacteroidota bacterium]
MKYRIYLIITLVIATAQSQAQLRVSDNQRFLVTNDGKPFFWLGDTAWELFHRLSREEADLYLQNRSDKGFTVIQAVALAELDGLHEGNFYGEIPLEDDDPTKPREAYFQHVDYIINKADQLGLHIGLLPTWGDKVFKNRWGMGPEIFNKDNAFTYGKWIGNRYKNKKNIIWILGGDRNPRGNEDVEIWRSMARGITESVGGNDKALMTFHPQPNGLEDGGSSKWFHHDEWLDFNMFQTGHCRENNVWDRIQVAYNKSPTKPVIDGEPLYEDHPVCFNAKDLGTSSAYDVRKLAYFDVFAGAFGHTYGCHDIWQMYAPNRTPVNGPHLPWYVAIDLPGSGQLKYLRMLIESRPFLDRVPDQFLITNVLGNNDHIQATRGSDYMFVYSAQGESFQLNTQKISGKELKGFWLNPRTGEISGIEKFTKKAQQEFVPPTKGYGHDWVLALDDASKNYSISR